MGRQFVQVTLQPEDGAVLVKEGVISRLSYTAAAGSNDETGFLAQHLKNLCFHGPESRFSVLGNDFSDGSSEMIFQGLVRVHKFLSQRLG